MINVFKKRTRLCALTTSTLFFLQGVDASMGDSWFSLPSVQKLTSFVLGSGSQEPASPPTPSGSPSIEQSPSGGQPQALPLKSGEGSNPVQGSSNPVQGSGDPVKGSEKAGQENEKAGQRSEKGEQGSESAEQGAGTVQGKGSSKLTFACNGGNYKSVASMFCDDGGNHVMKRGGIQTQKIDQIAVYATTKSSSGLSGGIQRPVTDGAGGQDSGLGVGRVITGTTIVLNNMSIRGVAPSSIAVVPPIKGALDDVAKKTAGDHGEAFAAGVLATSFSKVKLEDSNIKKFAVGVHAHQYGGIYMKGGTVYYTDIGAAAHQGSFVILDGVVFDEVRTGLHSSNGSRIMMKSGQINFAKGGAGVISENKGIVKLEGVRIRIKEGSGKQDTSDVTSFALLSDGGLISFHNGEVAGTDAVALWVTDDITASSLRVNVDALPGFLSHRSLVSESSDHNMNPVYKVHHVVDSIYPDVITTMNSIVGDENTSHHLNIVDSNSPVDALKVKADIKESNIKIEGRNSYGISFGKISRISSNGQKREERSEVNTNKQMVFLQKTSLFVPEGVAVYGNNLNGIVLLGEGTVLSGDSFLKAESFSNLAVYAFKSSIMGDSQISENAYARLYLSDESGWYLAKSNNRNLGQVNTGGEVNTGRVVDKYCIDSCVSFVGLANSAIAFLPPRDKNEGYQMLHIGDSRGVAYIATGDSKIYVNTSFVSDDSGNVKLLSDQLFIYGDVFGKTKVYVNDSSVIETLNGKLKNGEKVQRESIQNQAEGKENQNIPDSIPIVQVLGEANRDSFELATGYVTLQGSPYQYILRASDPIPGSGRTQLWKFNLESKLEGESDGSVNSPGLKVDPNASGSRTPDAGTPASDPGRSPSEPGSHTPQAGGATVQTGNSASDPGNPISQDGSPTSELGGSTLQTGDPATKPGSQIPDAGVPAPETGTPASDPSNPTSDPGRSPSEPGSQTSQVGGHIQEVRDSSLSQNSIPVVSGQAGSLEKDNVDPSTLRVSSSRGPSGHTLSLSYGIPTSDQERYGNIVVTKGDVDIVLLNQMDKASYGVESGMVEYNITDESGNPITFDSNSDRIDVIKSVPGVTPPSTPIGTGVTPPVQSNEASENVRTITHEGAGIPVAGKTPSVVPAGASTPQAGISTPESGVPAPEFGNSASDPSNQISQDGSPTSELGGQTPQAGGSTPQTGEPATKPGSHTPQAGGSTLQTGDPAPEAASQTPQAGSPASEPGSSASESGNPTAQAGNLTPQDGGPTSELGSPASELVSTPVGTGVTSSVQSNETSENVRTITDEGAGVPVAGETPPVVSSGASAPKASSPTLQVGNLTPQTGSGASASEPGSHTPQTDGSKLQAGSSASDPGASASELGSQTPQAGGSTLQTGNLASEPGSPTLQAGNLTPQAGKLPSAVKSTDSTNSTSGSKESISVKPVASEESRVPAVAGVSSAGKEGTPAGCNGIGGNGAGQSQGSILCSDGKSYTVQQLTLNANNSTQHSMHVKSGTNIKLNAATIIGPDSGNRNAVDLAKLSSVSAVFAEENAEVVLENKSIIQSSVIGLEAKSGGKVKMDNGTVNARYMAALAGTGAVVTLKNTQINVEGDSATAGLVSKGGDITMESGTITMKKGVAVQSEEGGHVRLNKVSVIAKKEAREPDSANKSEHAAILLNNNSVVEFTHGDVVTDANALWIRDGDGNIEQGSSRRRRSSDVRPSMNHANIEFSTIKVESDNSYGIYFDGAGRKAVDQQSQNKIPEKIVSGSSVEDSGTGSLVKRSAVRPQEKAPVSITGAVTLKRTNFEVLKSIAIYGNNSGGRVSLKNGTNLTGDLLLKAENNSHMSVLVDNSSIMGGVRVDKTSYATLDLTNRSEWYLTRSAHKNLRAPDSECVDSCISSVSLVNSDIHFLPSQSEELEYQTLRIGKGKGIVYKAQGDVSIHFNARLNPNDPSDRQVSDRLVIHGDVEGKTVVSVRSVSGSVGENNGSDKTAHSVSVIQVYGKAEKDSFRLDSDYVALGNSPYKYTLRSYSPEMTSKQEHVQQKFMKDGGEFWNFRLENQYVKSESFDANIISKADTISLPRKVVRSVVPQVPTYLLLPNSVFHAGLMDISNQNKQLETLRTTSSGMVEVRENPALYLRGYGGSYRYASDLSALEYGYGGDLSYNGVEAGVLLKTIENADNAISFGVMGSYGKLSLQPQDVEQSQESAFDKWTATAYGSLQHETGLYVDGLLSYGLFKGDVVTLARGKTATLKGNPLSVSLTGGQTFVTGYEGFVFDPQVQVVYQHLQFSKARDIDNFDIELGKLDQWVARVGGRLSKVPTGSEGVNAVAFYGKLYFAHGFGGNKSVHFKDAFQLGAFGSSLEAGLGFNAKLSSQFSLHGDVVYQHKLNKAGFSGTSFSGGIRYQF
ncbi:autotransporter outer membrane beta-barrel domain-containing protein [Bartonella taylorii]|uniref:autotransporter outer membrane beta-barrel domain-containing protein n=1 Tax=Bartonella taylorii TaxID=33046 RepID=UPI001FED5EE7|nr:autotransporter outer membrane beta-barrel domain-containing protein [Bartonella taylorii]